MLAYLFGSSHPCYGFRPLDRGYVSLKTNGYTGNLQQQVELSKPRFTTTDNNNSISKSHGLLLSISIYAKEEHTYVRFHGRFLQAFFIFSCFLFFYYYIV